VPNTALLLFFFKLVVQLLETCPNAQQTWGIPSSTHRPLDAWLKKNRKLLNDLLARGVQAPNQYNIIVISHVLDECDEDEVGFINLIANSVLSNYEKHVDFVTSGNRLKAGR